MQSQITHKIIYYTYIVERGHTNINALRNTRKKILAKLLICMLHYNAFLTGGNV
jgi:hypothetical protein